MRRRKSLSVVIITKNEENLLPDCLRSVSWADEIIVLDSGSQDDSVLIAQKMGAKIFTHTTWQGFGKQRQLAQKHASQDYILMIDADERVTPELRYSIEKVLTMPIKSIVYSFARRNLFLGRFMRYSGWYPDVVNRLYTNDHYYNDNIVHESLNINNTTVIRLRGDLLHLTCCDFFFFQRKQLRYAKDWAHQNHQNGQRCSYLSILIHTFNSFCKTWLFCAGFLDGRQGLLLALVNAQYTFNKYTALWSINQKYSEK